MTPETPTSNEFRHLARLQIATAAIVAVLALLAVGAWLLAELFGVGLYAFALALGWVRSQPISHHRVQGSAV